MIFRAFSARFHLFAGRLDEFYFVLVREELFYVLAGVFEKERAGRAAIVPQVEAMFARAFRTVDQVRYLVFVQLIEDEFFVAADESVETRVGYENVFGEIFGYEIGRAEQFEIGELSQMLSAVTRHLHPHFI